MFTRSYVGGTTAVKRTGAAKLDPDLMIRTSNEQRISNFLLWQCAYTELVFSDVLWPEFGRESLEKAVAEYNRRDRRFGAVAS